MIFVQGVIYIVFYDFYLTGIFQPITIIYRLIIIAYDSVSI